MLYDLVIIGGGPAAIAAGIYAARKRVKTLFITDTFGGQSLVSPGIENWIGEKTISGADLAKKMREHLEAYKSDYLEIKENQKVTKASKTPEGDFQVVTSTGDIYQTKAILAASGSVRRKLEVPGAKEFDQKGLTYCASCDGPMYADQDVAVIGGGNAGFESAAQLLAYCKSVTLLHRNPEFKAEKITIEKLLKNPKFHALPNVDILEVKGDRFVTGLVYKDKESGQTNELSVNGIFVEIGFQPSTDYLKDLVETDKFGAFKIDPTNQKTTQEGIWAAGDCTSSLYHQNNIAVGDAVRALEDIYNHLKTKK